MNFHIEDVTPSSPSLFSPQHSPSPNTVTKVTFAGRLDIDSVAELWQPCATALMQRYPQPSKLLLDVAAVDYCDIAGITFLQTLRKAQLQRKADCEVLIINLRADLNKLLTYIEQQPDPGEKQNLLHQNLSERLPERFGHIAVDVMEEFRDNITFIGMLAYQLLFVCWHLKKLRWNDFLHVIDDVGPKSLGIVALIGFLIGLISTFQAAPSFGQFGAQIFMVNLVSLGLVREMGPLLTAVLLAGRTASAFAAQLGTMKINREIDALETMGINPIRFLVVPRVLAALLITPLLEIFLIACGMFGCFIVMSTLGYTVDAFWYQLIHAVALKDWCGGLVKVFTFGLVIGAIGCLHGLKTGCDAQAVGRATTQAVVSSLIMLVVVDGIFAVLYYVLGI